MIITVILLNPSLAFSQSSQLISKWGSLGSSNGLFDQPSGIDMGVNGSHFFVVDTRNNRIQAFQTEGPFLTTWGSEGILEGEMNMPTGIAVDPSGKIVYVADTGNDRIQKFDSNGNFISSWGSAGSANSLFDGPMGIAVDPSGKIVYVADTGNDRIQKFDSNGNFISSWGSAGSANSLFDGPMGIAVDPSGKIVYVADTGNDRIQKFDSNGNFIAKWGTLGNSDGEFEAPTDIVVYKNEISVVDSKNDRIQKFDSNGNFMDKWGASGTQNGEFRDPFGISINSAGEAYVTDRGNSNVQSFSTISQIIQLDKPLVPPTDINATSEELSINNQVNVGLSDLPQSLVITDNSGSDNFLSLRAVVNNGQVAAMEEEGDFEFDNFEISDWYPPLTFQFTDKSELNFVNVKNVLVGQIKTYKSPSEILEKSTMWKNIPLNVETVLPIEKKGNNFLIAEIQFGKGVTGIYSGTFNLDDILSRSDARDILNDERKEGADYKVKQESKFDVEYGDVFWQLSSGAGMQGVGGSWIFRMHIDAF